MELFAVKKARAGKPGPKPKPRELVRHVPVQIVVTPAERDRLHEAAGVSGVSVSDFIRDAAFARADRVLGK